MRAIYAFFVLQVIALQLTKCQGGGGGGSGPSTFGYDASSACSKSHSRVGRAHYEDLPCDFRRQNWCTIAGSSYPWHAVRQFVHENQGLMRRMYGDETYFSVLRSELEKNDIELKYDEYHHIADDFRFQYDEDYYVVDQSEMGTEYGSRGFISRSFNDPIAKRLNKFPKFSEYTRPQFKPTEQSTSSTASSTTTPSSSTLTSATTSSTRATSMTPPTITTVTSTEEINTQSFVTSPKSTSPKSANTTAEITDNDSAISNTTTTTTALPNVTVAQIVKEQNFSINEIPGQNDRIDVVLEESAEAQSEMIERVTTFEFIETTVVPTELLVDMVEDNPDDARTTVHEEILTAASQEQQQQFRPRPEHRPTSSGGSAGQLFQDVAKDQVLKLRGANACPVKEEVVAPFWANNTRGEILALLNYYPFEQYVHWEKCTHENMQMYCRDGCKCEQQYRLHRLLAYDPSNECRGIFSDWFKFPSCCVCRCYDLPLEFRVASRSPRTSHKRRIKVQPPARDRYA